MLPRLVIRPLTDEEVEQYRRPFAEPGEGRRPTLTIPHHSAWHHDILGSLGSSNSTDPGKES